MQTHIQAAPRTAASDVQMEMVRAQVHAMIESSD